MGQPIFYFYAIVVFVHSFHSNLTAIVTLNQFLSRSEFVSFFFAWSVVSNILEKRLHLIAFRKETNHQCECIVESLQKYTHGHQGYISIWLRFVKNNKGNLSVALSLKVSAICAQLTRSYDTHETVFFLTSFRCMSMFFFLWSPPSKLSQCAGWEWKRRKTRPMDIIKNIIAGCLERHITFGHVASGMTFWQQYFWTFFFRFKCPNCYLWSCSLERLHSDHIGLPMLIIMQK